MMLFRLLLVVDALAVALFAYSMAQDLGFFVSPAGRPGGENYYGGMPPAYWLVTVLVPLLVLLLGIWLQRRGRVWLANIVLGVMALPILATAGFAGLFIIAGALR